MHRSDHMCVTYVPVTIFLNFPRYLAAAERGIPFLIGYWTYYANNIPPVFQIDPNSVQENWNDHLHSIVQFVQKRINIYEK